ncbi:Piso0_001786 [Millerozyma farinosa CBS 7064]|uniref:Piso0_001786 protein n=1 Tax=Pichia sorbitophila (strain ATCC MYA-4447 / BCRC 22081 / CBS 7064 / NBRC 10061 / NRRL Y-12695) TaxID=559304 RepID=G8YLQ7_PICSO|nr:Piso0_001786 [Millerozyma farinosa CBS 7064]
MDIDDVYDIENVLDLEDEYYDEGYKEGQDVSVQEQYLEGMEYGYQTGMQRFLIVGYMKGLIDYWKSHLSQYEQVVSLKTLENHLNQAENVLENISMANTEDAVREYEKAVLKTKNKIRVIASICKEQWKINDIDDFVKEVGGQLQASENLDDMW